MGTRSPPYQRRIIREFSHTVQKEADFSVERCFFLWSVMVVCSEVDYVDIRRSRLVEIGQDSPYPVFTLVLFVSLLTRDAKNRKTERTELSERNGR